IAAHCMAELVLAVESGYDHETKPLVVTGPHTNLKIDMGTFRRNRPINPNSPMSVHG
ncbi:MAG TPA: FAD-dependent oxidoreductase, partial [Acidimicrobiaceae bacterium]|nr:FAD-dependent oxidoreductase [Acidimicrobiaceae bacterium]